MMLYSNKSIADALSSAVETSPNCYYIPKFNMQVKIKEGRTLIQFMTNWIAKNRYNFDNQ